MTAARIADLQQLLLDSPFGVTHLLEILTGEPLVADVLRQYTATAGPGNRLEVEAGVAVTHRVAILKGCSTNLAYLYAESMFVSARLPEPARAQLRTTSDPIGTVLAAHGLKVTREALGGPPRPAPPVARGSVDGAADIVWARSYRLRRQGLAVFAIGEWFFRSVLDALDAADRPGGAS